MKIGLRCIVCDAPDLMPNSRKFCSGRCQGRAARARRRGADVAKAVPCVRCGRDIDLFAPGVDDNGRASTSGRKRRSDTKLCADCSRQRRYRHGWSAHALAHRDGTDCKLCRTPVDMTLRAPDPMSPSVDHVITRADGGTDDPSNLQLAHLTCNHKKSSRSGWTITEAAA